MQVTISICSREEINSHAWDEFIKQSPQYIIYGLSGYLDCVCEGWKGMVAKQGDQWLAVMPLNIGKKYLISYSLKPPFVQYLGVFFTTNEKLSPRPANLKKELVENIINSIPKNIKLFNHNFSPQFNFFAPFAWHGFKVKSFQSYYLNIDRPLEDICENFSGSVRKFIRKQETSKLSLSESKSVTWIAQKMQNRNIISAKGAEQFEKLWQFIMKEDKGFVLYVCNKDDNRVYCGGAFIVDDGRVIMLATCTDLRFKKTRAKTLMLWSAIQRAHCLKGIRIFDFMGSMMEGVVNYIYSFGAEPVLYLNISRNRLSIPYSIAFTIKEKVREKKISLTKAKLMRTTTGWFI